MSDPQANAGPRPARKLERKFRVRLKDGSHAEYNDAHELVMFNKGDVFMANRPYYKRWPEKFEPAGDYVPLSGGNTKLMDPEYDPDLDDEPGDAGNKNYPTAPSVPLPRQSQPSRSGAEPSQSGPQAQPQQQAQPQRPNRRQELMDDSMLDKMSANELRSLAEAEEIPLEGARTKPEIIQAIKKSR